MRTQIKVCCVSSREEAAIAVRAGASAVGLVAHMPSGPGVISDDRIAEIAVVVPPPVSRFLLTSRTDGEAIAAHARACRVDTVQIVDAVPDDSYAILRARVPWIRIVQVLHVENESIVDEAARVAPFVDAILLDSGRPSAAVRELGGTGRVHDWALSRRVVERTPRPVFLAGGLRAENVERAIAEVRPYGLDVCSGVRTNGRLDAAKLDTMIRAVEQADVARPR
jgi:phosphoribosylanthranilate isomerase